MLQTGFLYRLNDCLGGELIKEKINILVRSKYPRLPRKFTKIF